MNWPALVAFIRAKDATFAAAMRGVPREDIEGCEQAYGVRLPTAYADLLLTMGQDSGDFHPFGATQVHEFYAVIRRMRPADEVAREFFLVAFESDQSEISPQDTFLDLGRGDETDAPVVMFEVGEEPRREIMLDNDITICELITSSVFRYFELDRLPERRTVLVSGLTPERARGARDAAIALLRNMNCELVLPPLSRRVCLRGARISVQVEVDDGLQLLELTIASTDRDAVSLAVAQLLDNLPGAKVRGPTGALES